MANSKRNLYPSKTQMIELPHLKEIFDRLRRGYHLSPEDEPFFSALIAQHEAYAA